MKTLLLVALLALVPLTGRAASELNDRVRAEAQRCADALLKGDFATLIALTHPKVVAEMGGKEAAVASVAQSVAEMKTQGVTLEKVTIGAPSDPVANGAVVAMILPQTKILRTKEGRFRHVGYLLGVSEDGGGSWTFIDTSTLDATSLAAYFPPLNGLLTLPAVNPATRLAN